jgi:hypothetical protein
MFEPLSINKIQKYNQEDELLKTIKENKRKLINKLSANL